ncbi:hypothetical protein N6H18_09070 [Reichenbachiella agarivorans]|uniref:VWA domain-containing protein n=1 Tax=Reichenbachiella agarivorans TaxID=2979464 RepID=A0ABY6CXH1_9BACT|nr:hypothetical protein [Reichenbachiella agarivorans]UXP34093.1 hypothetical protein N6H18_09070 [Reichenbachiella agarivorans]
MPIIQFEYSLWLLPLYFLVSCAISYLLYSKKAPWSPIINRSLLVSRVIVLTLMFVLLLNPLINQYVEQVEKPKVILALDNSTSILNNLDSTEVDAIGQSILDLESILDKRGYEVVKIDLQKEWGSWDEVNFDQVTTDLNGMLREVDSDYENTNLAAVYLVSDGKFNLGSSPLYQPHAYVVNTIGVGDTIQKQDLEIRNALHNKIAYQGNRFPVVVEVFNYGFAGKTATVRIKKNTKTLVSHTVEFKANESLSKVEFELEATENGLQKFDIQIDAFEQEVITENNYQSIYIDVIDGRQNILLLAAAPHPDLKALKSVIERNQNFEVKVFVPGVAEYPDEKYDLVIVHNAYDRFNLVQKYVDQLVSKKVPMFYILGAQTNLRNLAQRTQQVSISQLRNQRDQVGGQFNMDAELFTINSDLNERWKEFSPLSVPYGEVTIPQSARVLLYQRVGSVMTNKPLLFTDEAGDMRTAYLLADGIWQWRLQEYGLYENTESFDEFFLKLVQYLSTKIDKRKFKFYPLSNEFGTNEIAQFQAELYDEIYDRVYGEEISVKIIAEDKSIKQYSFTPSSQYSRLEIANLTAGKYFYEAQVTLDSKTLKASGSFVVKEQQLEQLDQVADFTLLRQLAANNQGAFFTFDKDDEITQNVSASSYKSLVHFEENIYPAINLLWIMLLVLLLASLEWGIRKYSGGY